MKSLHWIEDYLSLLKLRIVALLVLVAGVAAIVAGAGDIFFGRITLLLLAGGMACAGSSLLNNYLDRDIDAIMERTKDRPLPNGRFAPNKVLLAGIVLLILSVPIALQLNYLVALLVLSGALVYVGLYTMWLKRRTSLNIVVGGLAGSCVVLAGWFSITNQLSFTPFLIALLIFLWTPSHFWSFALVHRESYQEAGVPMLPVVTGAKSTANYILLHSGLLLLASLLLYFLSPLKEIYLSGSLFLGAIFLASSIRLQRRPQRGRAWTNYKLSGVYLLGLFLVMALDVLV